jgi:MFS family permease
MTTRAATLGPLSVAATCLVAICALAVAMGIGRFAFTPMLPLMVRDGAISLDAGAPLAASNYLGYLVGALVAGRMRLSPPSLIVSSLVGTAAVTAATGAVDGLAAWLLLRFAAGVLSAWTLVATSTWVLQELAKARRTHLAGLAYSGVGLGIAITGVFCVVAARPGVTAHDLWVDLGGLAAVLLAGPVLWLGWRPGEAARAAASPPIAAPLCPSEKASRSLGIVICYGLFGFGYILPATFLPALAREVVDDPAMFGLAWPIFGIAAAISTVVVAAFFHRVNRLRVWACGHLLMGVGVALPSIWLSLETIVISAVLVGGTFMVNTMLGLQEARARSPDNPTAMLGLMTAAFAIGQLAGPLASGALDQLPIGHIAAMQWALRAAATGLAASAVALWWFSRISPNERSDALDNAPTTQPLSSTPQGFAAGAGERLRVPARDSMSEAQRHAADAIIAGPRKAIFGPFVPLLQCPALMEHVGQTGEALRFKGCLPDTIRELAICLVARETSNQFEWQMHAPLAIKAGIAQAAIDAIHVGRRPRGLTVEQETTVDFVTELMLRHGVSDATYGEAVRRFGEQGAVELTALVGYFAMVCWIMNVARTPGVENSRIPSLAAFPC